MSRFSSIHMIDRVRYKQRNLSIYGYMDISVPDELIQDIRFAWQAGKIGVLGGSKEYTGAPYYAAFSALKVGADLSHIFCLEDASTAIKSYSPEIIVHPNLKVPSPNANDDQRKQVEQDVVHDVSNWFQALHVLVIGPGLGRDPFVMQCTKKIIEKAREAKLPLLIDGDGLFLISKEPGVIQGYTNAVLTPNANEYGRLCEAQHLATDADLKELCKSFGHVTIVKKGAKDLISDGTEVVECAEEGSGRRSGGQGDVLSGTIAVFLGWADAAKKSGNAEFDIPHTILASYAGCFITRNCNKTAFAKHKRSTTTPNMIEEIGGVFESFFPADGGSSSSSSSSKL